MNPRPIGKYAAVTVQNAPVAVLGVGNLRTAKQSQFMSIKKGGVNNETITRAQKECNKFLKIEIEQIHAQLWRVTVEDIKQ